MAKNLPVKQNPDGPLVLLSLSTVSKTVNSAGKGGEDRTIIKHHVCYVTPVTNRSSSSTPSPHHTVSKLMKRVEYRKYTYTKSAYTKCTAVAINEERTRMKTGHEEKEDKQTKTNDGFAVKRKLYSTLFPPTLPIQLLG